jgi:peptidoglycan-associated lipoprotein
MARTIRLAAKGTVVGLVLGLALAGCAKKTLGPEDGAFYDDPQSSAAGADEEALNAQSSLERYRRGLAPDEDGVLKDVHFGYDAYELDANARDVLAANAEWLKENPGTRTEIEGHCDERGTIEYNLALGARRAKAAKDYLVSLGVSPDRLSTISYGEELPLCRDMSESCYARNRRVHFIPPAP